MAASWYHSLVKELVYASRHECTKLQIHTWVVYLFDTWRSHCYVFIHKASRLHSLLSSSLHRCSSHSGPVSVPPLCILADFAHPQLSLVSEIVCVLCSDIMILAAFVCAPNSRSVARRCGVPLHKVVTLHTGIEGKNHLAHHLVRARVSGEYAAFS